MGHMCQPDGDADGNGITAMVTLSCPHAAQAFSGSQAFVLSRTPSVDAKTMKTLMERAKAAIPNFSEYSFHVPTQTQQCQYKWPTPATTELGEERCHRGYERSSGPCSTFHFVQGNECNEFRIGGTLISYIKKTGVFPAGTCASQGYTVADGSKTTDLHQLAAEGRGVRVYIFEKAATTELGEEKCHRGYERSSGPCSTFHFVQGNECNEFRIGDTLIPYVKKTGVFSAGTCA